MFFTLTTECLRDVEDYCEKLRHVERVLQGALGEEGTGTGTGSVTGGKGTLDNINTEGMVRTRRHSFDGFDVEDGTDSSKDRQEPGR